MSKILVADDSERVHSLVRSILSREGFRVISARNGAEAIEVMLAEKPDVVLLDIVMPLMDGLEVLRRMAVDPDLAGTPTMMLTSYSHQENVEEALARGASDFLVKPFEAADLRQRVRRLLAVPRPPAPRPAQKPPNLTRRILIVDDQSTIHDIAREMLGSRFEIVTARSAPGALSAAVEHSPDLIIMDPDLPAMDSAAALVRLRSFAGLKSVPVLASGPDPHREAPSGFQGVLQKPFQRARLLRTVGQVLDTSGLYSFHAQGELVVVRFHPERLNEPEGSEPAQAANDRLWHQRDLSQLEADAEPVVAWMLAADRRWLVADLTALVRLPDQQVGAYVGPVRQVLARGHECRFFLRITAPYRLQRYFMPLRHELGVELYARITEVEQSLTGRRPIR